MDAPSSGAISSRGVFVQHEAPGGASVTTDTFTAHAVAAGDAILVHIACVASGTPPSSSTILAPPQWQITELRAGMSTSTFRVFVYGAIAPDTNVASFEVEWSAACTQSMHELGDEFSGADPTGGATTFETVAEAVGSGDCQTSLTTSHANDAIWAACSSATSLSAVGSGFVKGADDQMGSWSEYRVTADAAATVETATFTNAPGQEFGITAVAIKPQ